MGVKHLWVAALAACAVCATAQDIVLYQGENFSGPRFSAVTTRSVVRRARVSCARHVRPRARRTCSRARTRASDRLGP